MVYARAHPRRHMRTHLRARVRRRDADEVTQYDRPVLVAYDGSDEAVAALRSAVELFPVRTLMVACVWEPRLTEAMASLSGIAPGPSSAPMIAEVDRVESDLAAEAADAGASLARELGA